MTTIIAWKDIKDGATYEQRCPSCEWLIPKELDPHDCPECPECYADWSNCRDVDFLRPVTITLPEGYYYRKPTPPEETQSTEAEFVKRTNDLLEAEWPVSTGVNTDNLIHALCVLHLEECGAESLMNLLASICQDIAGRLFLPGSVPGGISLEFREVADHMYAVSEDPKDPEPGETVED